jgi:hypothetical protein
LIYFFISQAAFTMDGSGDNGALTQGFRHDVQGLSINLAAIANDHEGRSGITFSLTMPKFDMNHEDLIVKREVGFPVVGFTTCNKLTAMKTTLFQPTTEDGSMQNYYGFGNKQCYATKNIDTAYKKFTQVFQSPAVTVYDDTGRSEEWKKHPQQYGVVPFGWQVADGGTDRSKTGFTTVTYTAHGLELQDPSLNGCVGSRLSTGGGGGRCEELSCYDGKQCTEGGNECNTQAFLGCSKRQCGKDNDCKYASYDATSGAGLNEYAFDQGKCTNVVDDASALDGTSTHITTREFTIASAVFRPKWAVFGSDLLDLNKGVFADDIDCHQLRYSRTFNSKLRSTISATTTQEIEFKILDVSYDASQSTGGHYAACATNSYRLKVTLDVVALVGNGLYEDRPFIHILADGDVQPNSGGNADQQNHYDFADGATRIKIDHVLDSAAAYGGASHTISRVTMVTRCMNIRKGGDTTAAIVNAKTDCLDDVFHNTGGGSGTPKPWTGEDYNVQVRPWLCKGKCSLDATQYCASSSDCASGSTCDPAPPSAGGATDGQCVMLRYKDSTGDSFADAEFPDGREFIPLNMQIQYDDCPATTEDLDTETETIEVEAKLWPAMYHPSRADDTDDPFTGRIDQPANLFTSDKSGKNYGRGEVVVVSIQSRAESDDTTQSTSKGKAYHRVNAQTTYRIEQAVLCAYPAGGGVPVNCDSASPAYPLIKDGKEAPKKTLSYTHCSNDPEERGCSDDSGCEGVATCVAVIVNDVFQQIGCKHSQLVRVRPLGFGFPNILSTSSPDTVSVTKYSAITGIDNSRCPLGTQLDDGDSSLGCNDGQMTADPLGSCGWNDASYAPFKCAWDLHVREGDTHFPSGEGVNDGAWDALSFHTDYMVNGVDGSILDDNLADRTVHWLIDITAVSSRCNDRDEGTGGNKNTNPSANTRRRLRAVVKYEPRSLQAKLTASSGSASAFITVGARSPTAAPTAAPTLSPTEEDTGVPPIEVAHGHDGDQIQGLTTNEELGIAGVAIGGILLAGFTVKFFALVSTKMADNTFLASLGSAAKELVGLSRAPGRVAYEKVSQVLGGSLDMPASLMRVVTKKV